MKSLVKSFLCCLLFLSAFLLVACNNSTKNDIPTSEEIDNSQTTQGNIGDNIVDTEIAEGGGKTFKINYNLSHESVNASENLESLNEGKDLNLYVPTRPGYVFMGWFEDAEFNNEIIAIKNIQHDINIYPKWGKDSKVYGSLPVIEINTQGKTLPYDKETYINCSFKISNCEQEERNFEVNMKESFESEDSVGIRLRGNSTAWLDKQPYRIKFENKQKLLGMTKNRSWVLLADYLDNSAIRNYTAFSLAEKFSSKAFVPTPNHVVLYLNDEYKGLYLLTQQVDENKGRTNVEKDITEDMKEFPFLIEMDFNAFLEGQTGIDNFQPSHFYHIEIKYPEADERGKKPEVVFNYIQEYINAAFNSLATGEAVKVSFRTEPVTFEDLVDVDSFIEYWLVNEVMHNMDSRYKSIYMSKTANGKLIFGPVWDFDWSLSGKFTGRPYDRLEIETATSLCVMKHYTPIKVYIETQENFNKVCKKWDEIKKSILEVVEEIQKYKKVIIEPIKHDAKLWYGDDHMAMLQYDYVSDYLKLRYEYLDSVIKEENFEMFQ